MRAEEEILLSDIRRPEESRRCFRVVSRAFDRRDEVGGGRGEEELMRRGTRSERALTYRAMTEGEGGWGWEVERLEAEGMTVEITVGGSKQSEREGQQWLCGER